MPVPAVDEELTRWLVLCLRGRWEPEALELARDQPPLDWERCCQIVNSEALGPLLYSVVHHQALVPAAVEAEWEVAYRRNACRNALLFAALADILQALAGAQVEVIVLKGAALAERLYGDIAVRPMQDLDLLIRPAALPVARQVLKALHFAPTRTEIATGFNAAFRNEESLHRRGLVDVYVDLHWRLIGPNYYQRALAGEWFWQTARRSPIGDRMALVLGLEAEVLYLCAHLQLHHGGRSLLWLQDIAELLVRCGQDLDWEVLLEQAQGNSLVLPLQRTLLQLATDWAVPVPRGIVEDLRALRVTATELRAFGALAPGERTRAQRLLADLSGVIRWRQKWQLVRRALFPDAEYMQERYGIAHRSLVPFYYPYRWLRGLRRVE
ncbi:nucleotidyltransferase domain-containing protein [Gloeobacter kilaueensis]|uniref:Nucleotidyltransferase family protein n=1 Tax=Gloeobacter kilaueensis (strain ATCC BAA-2537 / CCAP 1431/1 / ULC 316 / JS1) TaxID=1183438 RepID=U5QHF9_GLOK1|nr:nucleotidyltransferase family protein [Gloeobacter kilaueensis]AGY58402.1 hypothetical protein GKIL_2156 [Gloeobacter kilaueensis JS1]